MAQPGHILRPIRKIIVSHKSKSNKLLTPISVTGQRDVRKRESGCPEHGGRHVGEAMVHYIIHQESRMVMGSETRSFKAAALIHRHIRYPSVSI